MSTGGVVPRLPVAPEQPPPEEDDGRSMLLVSVGAEMLSEDHTTMQDVPSEAPRMERLLNDWMQRLDSRLDRLVERLPPPRLSAVGMQTRRSSRRDVPATKERPPGAASPLRPGTPTKAEAVSSELKAESSLFSARATDSPSDIRRPGDLPASERSEKTSSPVSAMKEWLTQSGFNTGKFKKAGTAERISSHWAKLENSADVSRRQRCLARIVSHKWFDSAITTVVLFSAVMVGVQVDYEARDLHSQSHMFDYAEYVCTGVFSLELFLRLVGVGPARLCSAGERALFGVDVILVVVSWLEMVLKWAFAVAGVGTQTSVGRVIKLLRVGRLVRVLRTFRVFTELRVVASMIWNSFRSLMWLFSLLVGLGYCFALVLTQGYALHLSELAVHPENGDDLRKTFGSVLTTMYSLFKCMTGGRNWGEVADLIQPVGWFYSGCIVVYMFVNLFSVLNIVTGVFVDGAIELGKRDRSMMIQKQGRKREAFANHLVQLLRDMDSSGDGVITREEFLASFERAEVKEFMHALSIDLDDAHNMFTLLDRNMDGSVDIVEFVMGMEKLRGEAKSSDIHFLIMQSQHIMDLLTHVQGLPPEDVVWASGGVAAAGMAGERRSSRFSYRGLPGFD